jgi:hypothetical protein
MAGKTCTQCSKKSKNNSDICDPCLKKNLEAMQNEKKTLVNEVLMYVNFHRGSSTKDSVVAALVGCCDDVALNTARDLLYEKYGSVGLFEDYKKRVNSPNRTEKMALAEDIFVCLTILEDNGVLVQCTAEDWEKLPKVHPAKLSDIALADQVAELSEKFRIMQNNLADVQTDVMMNKEKIKDIENDSATHGKVLQEVVTKGKEAERLNAKDWPNIKHQSQSQPGGTSSRLAGDASAVSVVTPGQQGVHGATGGSGGHGVNEGFQRPKEQARRDRKQAHKNDRRVNNDGESENKQSRKNTGIVGQADNSTLRAAPMPSRDVFISRVHKLDGVTELENFIKSKGITPRQLTLACHEDAKFNSFKLSVSVEDVQKVMDPSIWAKGVKLRRWFDNRNKDGNSERMSASEYSID